MFSFLVAHGDNAASSSPSSDPSSSSSKGRRTSKPSPHSPRSLRSPRLNTAGRQPDESWDQIVSSRNPSQGAHQGDDEPSLWQQWVQSALTDHDAQRHQFTADQDDARTYQLPVTYLEDLLRESDPSLSSSSSSSSSARDSIPPLSYPPSIERPLGSDAEEVASSMALGKAGRKAFNNKNLATTSSSRKARPAPPGLPDARYLHLGMPIGAASTTPSILQRLQQQVPFEGTSPSGPVPSGGPSDVPPQLVFPPAGAEDDVPSPPLHPQPGVGGGSDAADALAILLPLLVLLSTLLLLLLLFLILLIVVRRRARIALTSGDGPLDVGREEELEGAGGLEGVEERWLETVEEPARLGYARAKDWLLSHPPASIPSEITISQFLSIQEKGVSAWSFEPDYEANSSCYVEGRTEITFLSDGEGMAPQEGGGCSVQSNLPLPKINEVYYWEAKMFTKPDTTAIAVGLATKPYPSFRLPGWSKFSVGFFSQDGFKCHNYPFAAQSYGPPYVQGDVIGVGYRPRTGTVFFTRNGKKFEDAYVGLHRYNLFPTIGADGPATIHVNLGQAGFVFLEANVKKWGLAPMVGTLAPPPAYGQEGGSILIETGQASGREGQVGTSRGGAEPVPYDGRATPPPPPTPPGEESPMPPAHRRPARGSSSASSSGRSSRRRRHHHSSSPSNDRRNEATNATPSLGVPVPQSPHSRQRTYSAASSTDGAPLNPPTPGHLDISLHSLKSAVVNGTRSRDDDSDDTDSGRESRPSPASRRSGTPASGGSGGGSSNSRREQRRDSYFPSGSTTGGTPTPHVSSRTSSSHRVSSPSPPPYTAAGVGGDDTTTSANAADESSSSVLNQPRRSSGRTHRLANSALGVRGQSHAATPSPSSSTGPGVDGVEVESEQDGGRGARDGRASSAWGGSVGGWLGAGSSGSR